MALTKKEQALQDLADEKEAPSLGVGSKIEDTFAAMIPGMDPVTEASERGGQQGKDISDIAKRVLGKDYDPDRITDKQWQEIRKEAGSELNTDETKAKDAQDGAGKDSTLAELAKTLADQYAVQGEEAVGQMGATLANQNAAVTNNVDQTLGLAASVGNTGAGGGAVQDAMDAYAKAYSSGEGSISASYKDSGLANQAYLAASPEQAYLQLLSQPGSEYFKEISPSLISQLPEQLQYALQQSELGVGEGQAVQTPKGGWPKSITGGSGQNNTSNLANALTAGLGSSPTSDPSVLSTGNPSTPGS